MLCRATWHYALLLLARALQSSWLAECNSENMEPVSPVPDVIFQIQIERVKRAGRQPMFGVTNEAVDRAEL